MGGHGNIKDQEGWGWGGGWRERVLGEVTGIGGSQESARVTLVRTPSNGGFRA